MGILVRVCAASFIERTKKYQRTNKKI